MQKGWCTKKYGSMKVRQYDSIKLCRFESLKVWQSESMTLWQSGRRTVWKFDSLTVRGSDSITVWQSYRKTVWQFEDPWDHNALRVFDTLLAAYWQYYDSLLTVSERSTDSFFESRVTVYWQYSDMITLLLFYTAKRQNISELSFFFFFILFASTFESAESLSSTKDKVGIS